MYTEAEAQYHISMNFVTQRIATGGAIASTNAVEALCKLGITDIINCRKEFDEAPILPKTMGYLWAPTYDDGQFKTSDWFDAGIKFALNALSQPKRKLYIHCAGGINRGPSMCYAVLRAQGLSAKVAEELIINARYIAEIGYREHADQAIAELGYA